MKFEHIEFDEEKYPKIDTGLLYEKIEELSVHIAVTIEKILQQVLDDNPDISINDMTLRCNLNYLPVDVITKDGRTLYEFEKDLIW